MPGVQEAIRASCREKHLMSLMQLQKVLGKLTKISHARHGFLHTSLPHIVPRIAQYHQRTLHKLKLPCGSNVQKYISMQNRHARNLKFNIMQRKAISRIQKSCSLTTCSGQGPERAHRPVLTGRDDHGIQL